MRGEADGVRAGLRGAWRMDGPKLRPETSASIRMGDSGWNERCLSYWGWLVCSSWGEYNAWHFSIFCGACF